MSLGQRLKAGIEDAKVTTPLKRLAKVLQEGVDEAEIGDTITVKLTTGRNPGITVGGIYSELSRIVIGDEEGTFSFSNANKTNENRRNIDRKRVIALVEGAMITACTTEKE